MIITAQDYCEIAAGYVNGRSDNARGEYFYRMALALAPHIRVCGIGPGPALPNSRQTPEQFARYQRVAELVGPDDADRSAGRERFRFYRERGYEIHHHELPAQ